jgi:hypothetical protein
VPNPSQRYTFPAPSGGLNAVDPIDGMDPRDATEFVNLVPTGLGAELRPGYTPLATTVTGGQTQMLASLPLADGTTKLVAATTSKLWEVLTGTGTDITGATSPTSGQWNAQVFSHKLFLANGVDTVQVYDGTSVIDSTFSGVTLSNLINVSTFKERLYFVEKNTLKFWYGNTLAVGASALSPYDLKGAFSKGGYLLFAGSYTNKFGSSSTDLFFACSSEGEILFYQGDSPDSSGVDALFSRVARYEIGRPLGYRAFVRVNADIWVLTEQGIIPVSTLFAPDPLQALADHPVRKINPIVSGYAAGVPTSFLWHGVHWPQGRKVFILAPTQGNGGVLIVYQTDAKGWTTYDLQSLTDCSALGIAHGGVYFGGTGAVFEAETGQNDNGSAINFNGRLAFSYLGSPNQFKTGFRVRPLMRTKRGLSLSLGIDTNFQRSPLLGTIPTTTGTFTPYGSPYGSPYSTDVSYIYERHDVAGQGDAIALRIQGSLKDAPLQLFGFGIQFRLGDE